MSFHKTKAEKASDDASSQRLHKLFDGAPGPSPWYLTPNLSVVKGFRWQPAGDKSPAVGKTLLMGKDGAVAVLNLYNYVMALDESTLLVWHQGSKKGVTVGSIDGPMRFLLIKPKLLTPFEGNLDSLYQEMNDRKDSIKLGGHASVEFELETNRVESDLVAEFPMQVRALDELLLFCRSSVIGAANGMSRANLALLVANPRASTYRLVPQDWFNKGHFDYGYQWATRVVRNPVTRYVHGEGIRIEPFVLDDSLRNLRVE